MKEYKYWIYYFKDTNEIYAYTDNKKYAKEFELDRNMDKFIKIRKDILPEEVNYLARHYQGKYLTKAKIKIYDKKTMKWFDSFLIMTLEEEITVQNKSVQLLYDSIYTYCWQDPYVFNEKIYKALDKLEYVNIYNQISSAQSNCYIENEIKLKPDELGIFVHYYAHTLRR